MRLRQSLLFLGIPAAFLVMLLLAAGLFPARAEEPRETVVTGKLFCSITRPVIVPFTGQVLSIRAKAGLKVKKGDELARYRLRPEEVLRLKSQVSQQEVVEMDLRLIELQQQLSRLLSQVKEARELVKEELASQESLRQLERQHSLLVKQKKLLAEKLEQAKAASKEQLSMLQEQLGQEVTPDHVPSEVALRAPMDGYVLGLSPEFREGADVAAGTPVLTVGVMDPMIVRTLVHEIELVGLKVGAPAVLTVESLPGREFKAVITRMSWSSAMPQLEQPSYYPVELEVPNPDLILKEGLRGRVTFNPAQ